MVDVTSLHYETGDGRFEHRIKLKQGARDLLSIDTEDKYFLVPVVDRSGLDFDDYEFKVVPHAAVATCGKDHRYWDGDKFWPAYNVTPQHRTEIAVGVIDLPPGDYDATEVDGTLFLQRVTEARSWIVDAKSVSTGVSVELPRDLLEYIGFDAGDKFYKRRSSKGNFAIWTPGENKGCGGSTSVKFPLTRVVLPYPEIGKLVSGEWKLEVVAQKAPWRLEFNLTPILEPVVETA